MNITTAITQIPKTENPTPTPIATELFEVVVGAATLKFSPIRVVVVVVVVEVVVVDDVGSNEVEKAAAVVVWEDEGEICEVGVGFGVGFGVEFGDGCGFGVGIEGVGEGVGRGGVGDCGGGIQTHIGLEQQGPHTLG